MGLASVGAYVHPPTWCDAVATMLEDPFPHLPLNELLKATCRDVFRAIHEHKALLNLRAPADQQQQRTYSTSSSSSLYLQPEYIAALALIQQEAAAAEGFATQHSTSAVAAGAAPLEKALVAIVTAKGSAASPASILEAGRWRFINPLAMEEDQQQQQQEPEALIQTWRHLAGTYPGSSPDGSCHLEFPSGYGGQSYTPPVLPVMQMSDPGVRLRQYSLPSRFKQQEYPL